MFGERSIRARLVVIAALVACNRDPAGAPDPLPGEPAARVELSGIAAPLPSKPAEPPGAAYFVIADKLVVRLAADGFTRLGEARQYAIRRLRLGGDGAVWIVSGDELLRLEGDTFRAVAKADFKVTGGEVDGFTVAADGHPWITSHDGVAHHDGAAWRREPKNLVGAADSRLGDIEVDRGGRVWALSSHKLHVREAGMWRDVDLAGLGEGRLFFESLALAPDDSLYALASSALLRVTPDGRATRVALAPRPITLHDGLAVSASGVVAVRDRLSGLDALDVPRGQARWHLRPRAYLWGEHPGALAADDGGRVWLSSERGLLVLGPGDAATPFPTGTIPAISGEITRMLVVGSGPARLPAVGPVRTGGLTGELAWHGVPLAGAEVEVCPSPATEFTTTPCGASLLRFTTVTDEQGVWTLADVPLGTYGIAARVKGAWRTYFADRIGAGMQEGRLLDVGRLPIADE